MKNTDENKNKLFAILESVPDALTINDLSGRIVECSAATMRILGYSSKEELIGRSAFDLIPPEMRSGAMERTTELLETGVVRDREYTILRKDGTTLDVELSAALVRDKNGSPAGIISVTKDVSERKAKERELRKAEEALKESENKYRKLFSNAPVGIFIMSLDGKGVLVNEAFAAMHGYDSPEEMKGISLAEMDTPESSKLAPERMRRIIAGEFLVFEVEHYRKDGHVFPLSVACNVVEIDGAPHFMGFHQDITDLKRAEKALRESERKYASIISNIPDVLWSSNQDGETSFISANVDKIFGYTPEEIYAAKHLWTGRIHRDDIERVLKSYSALFLEQKTFDEEYRIQRKDGQWIWLRDRSISTYEVDGVLYADGVFSDITERKQAEREMKESEERFRLIFQNSDEGVIIYNTDLEYIYWNPYMERISGKLMSEVVGRLAFEVFPQIKEHGVDELLKRALKGEKVTKTNMPFHSVNGLEKKITGRYQPYMNTAGEIIGVLGIVRDTTELWLAEEALRKSEEQFRLAFEQSKDAIFWADVETELFVNCNKSAEQLVEMTRDEIIGQHQRLLHPPVVVDEYERKYKEHMEQPQARNQEANILTKSGRIVPVEISSTVVKIGDRTIIQGIFRDVSERNKANEDKEALMQQLHQSQKMEAIGQLAGGIAHDFNNILAIIIGTAEMVSKEMPEQGRAQQHMARISRVAKRAKDLTLNLLTFARKEKLDIRSIRTDELMQELVDLLKRSLSKKVRIVSECSHSVTKLSVDVSQMSQALLNVCINAADAMPDGGTLTMMCEDVALDRKECEKLHGIAPGRYSRITISDTGAGMPKDVREQIFDPFFTTKERGKGTGLGMPITLGIVQSHGGAISVESEPGKGTKVEIYLPGVEATTEQHESPCAEEQQAAAGGTVLIIDDEPDFLNMTTEILQTEGFRVIPALGPGKAIELFRKHDKEIDVVILDMMMPEMGGDEVFRVLRDMNPEVKVLLCSGYSKDGRAGQILSEGANGFLQKPFDCGQMLSAISSLIQ